MTASWILESDRLRLREFGAADSDALVRMHSDPRVRALLLDDYPLDVCGVAQQFIDRMQTLYRRHDGLGIWHAERKLPPDPQSLAQARDAVARGELSPSALAWLEEPDWVFCGWFNLMPMPDGSGRVEIGCRLCHDAWGLGLALEGGEALLDHAFGPALSLREVWATCDLRHRSVQLVLQALGFESRGVRPYEGSEAAWYAVESARWAMARQLPRRERQRSALRALAAAPRADLRGPGGMPTGEFACSAGPRTGPHEDRSQLTNSALIA